MKATNYWEHILELDRFGEPSSKLFNLREESTSSLFLLCLVPLSKSCEITHLLEKFDRLPATIFVL